MKEKILFSWSSGKDSALALAEMQKYPDIEVAALLTLIIEDYGQVGMHGVRVGLVQQQAQSIGIPLEKIFISPHCPNEEYEAKMKTLLLTYQNKGVSAVAFGDLFLEDLRKYRENNLARIGMKALFPLWKKNSTELARTFLDQNFKAIVTCVDSQVLDPKFIGRHYDEYFLAELPAGVDPCGEKRGISYLCL